MTQFINFYLRKCDSNEINNSVLTSTVLSETTVAAQVPWSLHTKTGLASNSVLIDINIIYTHLESSSSYGKDASDFT